MAASSTSHAPTNSIGTIAPATRYAIAAAALILLFLIFPVIIMHGVVNWSPSGAVLSSWTGWVTFLLLAAAALVRFFPRRRHLRDLLDKAAFAMVIVTALWSVFVGPFATEMMALLHILPAGTPTAASLVQVRSVGPDLGLLMFVLAPLALWRARAIEAAA